MACAGERVWASALVWVDGDGRRNTVPADCGMALGRSAKDTDVGESVGTFGALELPDEPDYAEAKKILRGIAWEQDLFAWMSDTIDDDAPVGTVYCFHVCQDKIWVEVGVYTLSMQEGGA